MSRRPSTVSQSGIPISLMSVFDLYLSIFRLSRTIHSLPWSGRFFIVQTVWAHWRRGGEFQILPLIKPKPPPSMVVIRHCSPTYSSISEGDKQTVISRSGNWAVMLRFGRRCSVFTVQVFMFTHVFTQVDDVCYLVIIWQVFDIYVYFNPSRYCLLSYTVRFRFRFL